MTRRALCLIEATPRRTGALRGSLAAAVAAVAAALFVAATLWAPRPAFAVKTMNEISALQHRDQKDPLDEFVKANPSSADGHFHIGVWYYEEERLADALAEFKKALDLEPDNFKALANASIVLDKMKKTDEGLALYEAYLKRNPKDTRAIAYYGEALWSASRRTEGFEQYKKALALDPNCPEAHFNLGAAFAEMGIYREAINQWKMVVSGGKPDDLVSQAKNNITRAEGKL